MLALKELNLNNHEHRSWEWYQFVITQFLTVDFAHSY